MAETTIEWTNRRNADGSTVPGFTFNPWIGCEKVSPACDNCYAERDMANTHKMVKWGGQAVGGERKVTIDQNWKKPTKWADAADAGTRPLVFTASLSDIFENWKGPMLRNGTGELLFTDGTLPWRPASAVGSGERDRFRPLDISDCRARLFRLMAATAHKLDYLVLSKRAAVMATEWPAMIVEYCRELRRLIDSGRDDLRPAMEFVERTGLMPNVWPGVTVESQQYVFQRLPHLCAVKAVRRFVSIEPQVGPVVLRGQYGTLKIDYLADTQAPGSPGVHWVITGGESGGENIRPYHPNWARELRDQCASGREPVPFLLKQWGEVLPIDQAVPEQHTDRQRNIWYEKAASTPEEEETMKAECRESRIQLPMVGLRIGKKAAGRSLDGVVHHGIPASVI